MLSATAAQVQQPSAPVKLQRLRLTKEEFRASIPQSTCPKRCAVSRQKRLDVAASPCSKVIKTPPVPKLSSTANIQRPRLSREEFQASIPQSARPKRFDTNRRTRLTTGASVTGSKFDSPQSKLNIKIDNQLRAMQHDSRQDSPYISPNPNGHSNQHHLIPTSHLSSNRSNGDIGLEKYPGPEYCLPLYSKLSNPTPNAFEFLSCKPLSIQPKTRPNIYDYPPNDPEYLVDQAQASQEGKDGSTHIGTEFPDKNCVENVLSKVKSVQMLRVRLEEKENHTGLLNGTDRELLGVNQNINDQLGFAKTPTSGSKHPRVSTDHEPSTSNKVPFHVDDENRVTVDEVWDELPPKKRRMKRKNRKTGTKNASVRELATMGSSKLGAEGSQNKENKLARRKGTNLLRRLPVVETELALIPNKFEDLDSESLASGQTADLSDDPISQTEEEEEVEEIFAIEHRPRSKITRLELKRANHSQKRFQIINEMAGLKPKSLKTHRSSEVTLQYLSSCCDGFEGKEAVPIRRFMPIRTQRNRHRRERQLITCFPSLVLVTEKFTQEPIQKDIVTRRLRKHKSELNFLTEATPNHVSHCPKGDDVPILINEKKSAGQSTLQPQTSIPTEVDKRILPLVKNFATPATTKLALSSIPENYSRITRSSPLKHKLIRNQHRRAGSNELIIPKLPKVSPPFGLQLHPDETMRLSQQAEMASKMRSVPRSLEPVLYDLQISQELMSVSIPKRISRIQFDNTSSENEDEELFESDENSESQQDVTEEEKDISNGSSELEVEVGSFHDEKNEVPDLLVAVLESIYATDGPSKNKISDEESMSEYTPNLCHEDINTQEEENSESDPGADLEDAEYALLEHEEPVHDDAEQHCGKMTMSKVYTNPPQQIISDSSGVALQVTSSEQLWGCINTNAIYQTPQMQEYLRQITPNNKNDHHLVQVFNSTPILNPDSSFRPQTSYSSNVFIEAENEVEEGLTQENKRTRVKRNSHMTTNVRRNPHRYKTLDLVKTRPASPSNVTSEPGVEASWHSLLDHLTLQVPRGDSQGSTILGSPHQKSRDHYHIVHRLQSNLVDADELDESEVPEHK